MLHRILLAEYFLVSFFCTDQPRALLGLAYLWQYCCTSSVSYEGPFLMILKLDCSWFIWTWQHWENLDLAHDTRACWIKGKQLNVMVIKKSGSYKSWDVPGHHGKNATLRVGIIAAIIHFHFGLGLKRRILQCCILVWHSKWCNSHLQPGLQRELKRQQQSNKPCIWSSQKTRQLYIG